MLLKCEISENLLRISGVLFRVGWWVESWEVKDGAFDA
jgi:hypothetical protein